MRKVSFTMSANINEVIVKRYNKVAKIYDYIDKMIKVEWRRDLLNLASKDVLEVGVGTGVNLPLYSKGISSLTGVDFSIEMLNIAKRKEGSINQSHPNMFLEADIQDLPFEDDTFDTVVSTCVFCSVPDPIKGLKEIRRVCKPDGQILMLEHMRSENKIIGAIMDLLNPIPVKLWGANINRETMNNIEAAGLSVISEEYLMGTILRILVLTPKK